MTHSRSATVKACALFIPVSLFVAIALGCLEGAIEALFPHAAELALSLLHAMIVFAVSFFVVKRILRGKGNASSGE